MKTRLGIRSLMSFSTLKLHYSIILRDKEIKTLDTVFRNSMAFLGLLGLCCFLIRIVLNLGLVKTAFPFSSYTNS